MTWPKSVPDLLLGALVAGLGALATRHTRARAKAREWAANAAYPPLGQIVTVNGAGVHAIVSGSGPDLVLIHGASGNARDFSFDLIARLAPHFRVIAFDRPGLGWSDPIANGASPAAQAAQLQAAALALGVTRPIVLGHSYGGAVAMAWALLAPDQVAGVALLGGAVMPWPGGLGPYYAITGNRLIGPAAVALISAFVSMARAGATVDSVFAPDPAPQGYASYLGTGLTLRRATLLENARQVTGLKPHVAQMYGRYGSLKMPVEILHGTLDSIVPPQIHALPLSRALPHARLTLIDGAGHMPHHSHPDQVTAALHRLRAALH